LDGDWVVFGGDSLEVPVPPPNTIGVGWLSITAWVPVGSRADWVEALGRALGGMKPRTVATRGYSTAWDVLDSSTISIHHDRLGEIHVSLAQRDCETLGWKNVAKLYRWASKMQRYNVSRLDLNYDDKRCVVMPRHVHATVDQGQTVTHTEDYGLHLSKKTGETAYVGSRSSRTYLRVYRGEVVHGGVDPFIRWEMELKRETAKHWGDRFFLGKGSLDGILTSGEMVPTFWGMLRGFVDFRDRTVSERPEECPVLPWWIDLTGAAARRRGPKFSPVPPSFHRSANWVINQVAPTLAYLVREEALSGHGGYDWLGEVIAGGERRVKSRERVASAAARAGEVTLASTWPMNGGTDAPASWMTLGPDSEYLTKNDEMISQDTPLIGRML
jgi:hypothetical protein